MASVFTYILILLLLINSQSIAQWSAQTSNATYPLRSVYFVDANTGWSCGFNTVVKTTNGGAAWVKKNVPGAHRSIVFMNAATGYMCGESGKAFKTTDGGDSWISLNTGVNAYLNQIRVSSAGTILIAGHTSLLLRSTDGGSTFENIMTSFEDIAYLSIQVIDENNFIVSGTESTIQKTTDGAVSWQSMNAGMPNPLQAVVFTSGSYGWATGCCGIFLKTTDAGSSWHEEGYLTPGYTLYSLQFIGSAKGWVTGDLGYMFRTTNSGMTWDSLYSGTHGSLYSLHFIDENTGYACGENGTILKTTNGGGQGFTIGIQPQSSEINTFQLYQNYPNPFNPSTLISYNLSTASHVTLQVYDVSGKLVSTLIDKKQSSGFYEIDFNGNGLPSGVYYYAVSLNGILRDTKKMILLK